MFAASKTGSPASEANYIESVFSSYLYTGNGSTQTITNGIDLSTKGGLVWIKGRGPTDLGGGSLLHYLFDTNRGVNSRLSSESTGEATLNDDDLSSFNTNGFSLDNTAGRANKNTMPYVSWTFREQAKFFDVVTWTSTNNANARIPHNLGSVPGCYIIKRTDGSGSWFTYHTSLGRSAYLSLNTTNASASATNCWGTTDPTSTDFGVNETFFTPGSGNYVAYLFAHNAGGFGLTGTDNVISCGTFTTNSIANADVTLGYEPQFVITKSTSVVDWYVSDIMRDMSVTNSRYLIPNTSGAEVSNGSGVWIPTATGLQIRGLGSGEQTHIYIAIRRGPMKTPSTGTSVYSPNTYTGTGATLSVSGISFPPDLVIPKWRSNGGGGYSTRPGTLYDKLRGPQKELAPTDTTAESTQSTGLTSFNQSGFTIGTSSVINSSPDPYISWNFRRAPGFFDEVCYTGTGSSPGTQNHNLGVIPEFILTKKRSATEDWSPIFQNGSVTNWAQFFALTSAAGVSGGDLSSYVSSSTFSGNVFSSNNSGATYVAYLFATCAGVSKVGSYTGTGALQTVNCGFAAGARFVLIKRFDSTGDWYVWDSARGISSGNDPYLLWNSTAAEVTNTNYVDTDTTGFKVTAAAPAALNASGGTYIFLAIA